MILNEYDLIFEKITDGLYVMIANRFGQVTDCVYEKETIDKLAQSYKVAIR